MTNTKREIGNLKLFTGNANPELAQEIAEYLGVKLGAAKVKHFSDGEISLIIDESVRGCDAYIIQPTCSPVNDNLMELLIMTDALRRASASRITAVLPYYGYARQDRKARARDPISAKLVADILSVAGVDRIITMDLHADQIQGFFDVPVDHLYASNVFVPYIQSLNLEDLVIATPDVGGSKRASSYSKYLHVPLVLCHKTRAKANQVESIQIIGDVEGKNVVLVDDIVDTAGTICKAADVMFEAGAKSVRAIASHCVMSGPASGRVEESRLEEIVFTNSIPFDRECSKLKQLSIAPIFAETIRRVMSNESISSQYII